MTKTITALTIQKRDKERVNTAVERLCVKHHVDDEAFARAWLEHREHSQPRGARALRYELRQKGVGNDIIDHALTEWDEEASA